MGKLQKIHYVLLFSFLARVLLYFFQVHPVWWDTGVYASMGKYIFSFGKAGLWEPVRPLVFPVLMGLASKFGAAAILAWGFFLELFFIMGSIYLTYLVGKELFDENTGLFASLLLSFTPFFFYFGYIPLSGIPSAFFALLAIYFFIKKKDFTAGILAGVAAMTRFPQGLVLVAMLLLCFSIRRFLKIGTAFFLALVPFLLLNLAMYNNPFLPFTEGAGVIAEAGLWLFQGGWHYYIAEILKDNILFLFAFAGIAFSRKKNHFCITLPLLLLFVYFSTLAHKELRFALIFLPYLAITASYGFHRLIKSRRAFYILLILAVAVFLYNIRLETSTDWEAAVPFYTFLEGEEVKGEVLTSSPVVGLYADARLKLLYYPVFDYGRALYWIHYMKNTDGISHIFIDTCSGLLCAPDNERCLEARQKLIDAAKEGYDEMFYREGDNCLYIIFKNRQQY